MALAAVLAGCARDENPGAPAGDPIRAMARTLSVETRAAVSGTSADGLKALVLTSKTSGNYASLYGKGHMTFGSAAVAYAEEGFTGVSRRFPPDGSTLYICALLPFASADAAQWNTEAATASLTFTGKDDVMAAGEDKIAKQEDTDNDVTKVAAFEFHHLLTKLDFKVKAEDKEASEAWGNVLAITIGKVQNVETFKNSATVTYTDGSAATASAFSGTAAGPWKTYTTADAEFKDQSLALPYAPAEAVAASTTLLAPFIAANPSAPTVATADLVVDVTTKTATGTPVVTSVPVAIEAGDTQGKAYTVVLNFKAKAISGTATIAEWGKGADSNVDVE